MNINIKPNEKTIKKFNQEDEDGVVLIFDLRTAVVLVGSEISRVIDHKRETNDYKTSIDALFILLNNGYPKEEIKEAIDFELPMQVSKLVMEQFQMAEDFYNEYKKGGIKKLQQ
jgi:hypothetical protein